MKKFLRILLCVFVVTVLASFVTASADGGKTEISFSVGDDTLMINGEAVVVEKPYVVGEGVTLVPLRVITEAFGAKVEWFQETKSIKITYPDVDIMLQIANKVAEVNSRAETLLSAPELTSEGVTMVPLRFISETFGADVSYDDVTKKITVVKESAQVSSTVEGSVNSTYIGDSYYNWYMENPKDMYMDYRSFDGTETSFSYDENNYIYVSIYLIDEEYDFEKDFVDGKAAVSSSGYSLVKAEKDTSNSNAKEINIQAKDKYEFLNLKRIVTDKYYIDISGCFENENTKVKDEGNRIVSTFEAGYLSGDIYDLSNVENGFRTYTAENLNLSFDVPEDFYMSSYEDSENEFDFERFAHNDSVSTLKVNVYSKSETIGASELANKDYAHNKKLVNEDIAEFSAEVEVKQYESLSVPVYEYDYQVKSTSNDFYVRDSFFEIGEYVYNITIYCGSDVKDVESYANVIINSINAKEIDAEKVGILLRNDSEATGEFNSKFGNATFILPNNYYESVEGNSAYFIDPVSGTTILAQNIPSVTNMSQVKSALIEIEKSQKANKDVTILSATAERKFGENKYYTFVMCHNDLEGEKVYCHQYATLNSGSLYYICVYCPELSYSEYYKNQIEDIIKNVSFK